jgi:hypothetical protein
VCLCGVQEMLNRFGSFTIKEFMGLVEANEVRF